MYNLHLNLVKKEPLLQWSGELRNHVILDDPFSFSDKNLWTSAKSSQTILSLGIFFMMLYLTSNMTRSSYGSKPIMILILSISLEHKNCNIFLSSPNKVIADEKIAFIDGE